MSENASGEPGSVETVLDSTLDSVDRAEEIVMGLARTMGFDEDDLHKIGIAVRESVVNAVVHGNRYSEHKKVRLTACRNHRGLVVTVTDQGDGFDLALLPDPLAEENLLRQSGRGILLMQAFVDDFRIRRLSPGGTEVRMVKHFRQSEMRS
jgi:serine/threonine-protein kinase RsbW